MKFDHHKPVYEIRSSKEGIGKDVGIYCWWFKDDCVESLLKKVSKDIEWDRLAKEPLQHKKFGNVKYTALYIGIAADKKKGILARFKWHIEQKHTVSNVSKGFLSTLRRTLSALNGFKLLKNSTEVNLKSQEKLNAFIDENCVLEWNYYPGKTKEELAAIEEGIINSGYYPLNIQGNRQVSKELRKKLGNMRKEICSEPQH